jgi:hypothetical protein
MSAADFDTAARPVQLGLFAAPDALGTPDLFDSAEDADPAANPGWWETAINSGDYGWDGDEAPTATDNRTATP